MKMISSSRVLCSGAGADEPTESVRQQHQRQLGGVPCSVFLAPEPTVRQAHVSGIGGLGPRRALDPSAAATP
jgi:hypothetical protein